jgi:hypothetical protein
VSAHVLVGEPVGDAPASIILSNDLLDDQSMLRWRSLSIRDRFASSFARVDVEFAGPSL